MSDGDAHGRFQLMNIGLEVKAMTLLQFRVIFIILRNILDAILRNEEFCVV